MRKYVISVVVLSFLYALSACENNTHSADSKDKTSKKEQIKLPVGQDKASDTLGRDKASGKVSKEIRPAEGEADTSATHSSAVKTDLEGFRKGENFESDSVTLKELTSADTSEFQAIIDSNVVDTAASAEDFTDDTEPDASYSDEGNYHDSGLQLRKERLLKTELLKVIRPEYKDTYDSVLVAIENRISIKPEEVSQMIVVERWMSPVNYRGYRFNRKKLMVYGVDKQIPIQIYYYLNAYYLMLHNEIYFLDETSANTGFMAVKDSLLVNYLLKYEF